jgi:acyl transferase domain-containing protein
MLAVALSESTVVPYLRPGVELAAVNDPLSCVLAGSHEAIARFETELQRTGVDAVRLPVSHAAHCSLMEPIVETFCGHVRDATPRPPVLPIASNLSGRWLSKSEAIDPDYWAAHMREPVRFAEGLSLVLQNPGAILIECGPGYTLSSLARRQCLHATDHLIVNSLFAGDGLSEDACFARALSQCWATGVNVDWDAYHADHQGRRVSLPTYPFERRRFLLKTAKRTDRQADTRAVSIDATVPAIDHASVVAEQLRVMSKQLDLIES